MTRGMGTQTMRMFLAAVGRRCHGLLPQTAFSAAQQLPEVGLMTPDQQQPHQHRTPTTGPPPQTSTCSTGAKVAAAIDASET